MDKSASRSEQSPVLPDYVRETVVEIEKKLDSSLPLPNQASDMTVGDYDLYIQMAQVFGLLAKTSLAATRASPVSEQQRMPKAWLHSDGRLLSHAQFQDIQPSLRESWADATPLYERNSDG